MTSQGNYKLQLNGNTYGNNGNIGKRYKIKGRRNLRRTKSN